jgi:hypothetical protein
VQAGLPLPYSGAGGSRFGAGFSIVGGFLGWDNGIGPIIHFAGHKILVNANGCAECPGRVLML